MGNSQTSEIGERTKLPLSAGENGNKFLNNDILLNQRYETTENCKH